VTLAEAASTEITAIPVIASHIGIREALRAARTSGQECRHENDKSGHLGFSKRLKAREATTPLPTRPERVAMA